MKKLFTLLMMVVTVGVFAQTEANGYDAEAGKILKALAAKYKGYSTISAYISYKIVNKDADINEEQKIDIQLKGNQFRINMDGLGLILCNGSDIWNLDTESKEASVNVYEPSEEGEITPSNVFTMYEKGFFYIMGEEFKIDDKQYQSIDLAPEDKTKEFFKIRMFVDPNEKYVKRMRVFGKDGTHFIYDIKTFKGNEKIEDSKFNFTKEEFPGYDLEDLR